MGNRIAQRLLDHVYPLVAYAIRTYMRQRSKPEKSCPARQNIRGAFLILIWEVQR